jgi:hypothetical protein
MRAVKAQAIVIARADGIRSAPAEFPVSAWVIWIVR